MDSGDFYNHYKDGDDKDGDDGEDGDGEEDGMTTIVGSRFVF